MSVAWSGSEFHNDTRETPVEVAAAEKMFDPIKGRFLRCKRQTDALSRPEPGSKLDLIDQLTSPFNTSEQVRTYLLVAIDSLGVLLRYLSKTKELPMLAFYSMIRSAIESTSYGIWLLRGNGNNKKASLSLRMSLQNFKSFRSLGAAFSSSDFGADIDTTIRSLHNSLRGLEPDAIDKPVQAANVIMAVDGYANPRASFFTGLQVWRSTSGIVHANAPVMAALLERHPDGPNPGDPATRTSRLTFTVGFIETAVENIETLLKLYGSSSAAPVKASTPKPSS